MNSCSRDQHSSSPQGTLSMNSTAVVYSQLVGPDLLAENNHNHNHSNQHSESRSTEEAAVLPPTYAALPSTKLEEEPNPFEQSFEGATIIEKHALSSVQSIDHPALDAFKSETNQWGSLRSGILLPSMLTEPVVESRPPQYQIDTTTTTTKSTKRSRNRSFIVNPPTTTTKKTKKKNNKDPEDEEKRKNFLERNRIAALKCRQRKKQWLQNLQLKVEYLAADNEQYRIQANALSEESIQLRTMLMAHKDCPVNQQAIQAVLCKPVPGIVGYQQEKNSNL